MSISYNKLWKLLIDKGMIKNFIAALKHFHYSVETTKTNLKY